MLVGEVLALGEVLGDVVQLPASGAARISSVSGVALRLLDDRLPAVGPQRARARSSRSTATSLRVGAAASSNVCAKLTPSSGRCATPLSVARRRRARAPRAPSARCRRRARTGRAPRRARDALRPVHDQRVAHAALVQVALPAPQRRVAGPRPAPRIVRERPHAAPLVEVREVLLDRRLDAVGELVLVERAVLAALGATRRCPRPAGPACCRARRAARGSRSRGRCGGRSARGTPRRPPSAARRAASRRPTACPTPCTHSRPRRQPRARRHDAHRELAREHLVAPAVPALVELAAVALDPLAARRGAARGRRRGSST